MEKGRVPELCWLSSVVCPQCPETEEVLGVPPVQAHGKGHPGCYCARRDLQGPIQTCDSCFLC